MREHSEAEIRMKLKQKKIPPEDHENVIARLKEKNFLDDSRFFDVRCRALMNRRQGRMRIMQDLRSKNIAWNEERFRELELEARGETGSADTLESLIDKKMRESRLQKKLGASATDRKELMKLEQNLLRTLVQKGFSAGESMKAIKGWLKKRSEER
ncbi:MAG: regulatory protein RecX [Bdellovibrionota bacterium]